MRHACTFDILYVLPGGGGSFSFISINGDVYKFSLLMQSESVKNYFDCASIKIHNPFIIHNNGIIKKILVVAKFNPEDIWCKIKFG
jgi:hypothetical protein